MNVYDSGTLHLIETRALDNLWGTPSFGKGVEYYINDRILFAENIKSSESEPNNFKYFIYDVSAKKASQKVSVNETGYGIFSRDGGKIIIIEISASSNNSLNKVDIYDSSAGVKLKQIDFNNKYKQIRTLQGDTISPDGSKLYLIGKSLQAGSSSLIVVDLKTNYSIVAEIPNITASWLVFFEE